MVERPPGYALRALKLLLYLSYVISISCGKVHLKSGICGQSVF